VSRLLEPWRLACVIAACAFVALLPFSHATAWHYFDDAAHHLIDEPESGGRLGVYANHPEYQFGPLAILIASPFAFLPDAIDEHAAMAFGSALGVLAVAAIADMTRRVDPIAGHRVSLAHGAVGFAALTLVWSDISVRTAHIDDAVVLAATAGALAATMRRMPWIAAGLLSVAAATKPWGFMFAPLVFALPRPHAMARLATVGAVVALTWLPFVVAEPETLGGVRAFKLDVEPSSSLRTLGVDEALMPGWVRPTQLAAGFAVALLLVRRGRWPAVVMAAIAVRLLLDPAVHHYLTAGVALGVLMWEMWRRPWQMPWLTVVSTVVLETTSGDVFPARVDGAVRLMFMATLVVLAFAVSRDAESRAALTPSNRSRSVGRARVVRADRLRHLRPRC
jgi:hypothetical protein